MSLSIVIQVASKNVQTKIRSVLKSTILQSNTCEVPSPLFQSSCRTFLVGGSGDFCDINCTNQSKVGQTFPALKNQFHRKVLARKQPKPVINFQKMDYYGSPATRLIASSMNQPLTVCVEGNIGSGKTTFLKHFKKYPDVCVFDEPISKWRDCQGYNLLDLMYKDPQKWSLCFQSYVQLTMLDLHTKPVVQPIKMMERSIFSAQYCFVQNLRDEGLMQDAQYAVLSEWFNFATTNLPIKLDLIVYLRADPEVAHKRIAQRGRSEENSIKLEYLQSVHELHEDWLIRKKHLLPCPVLTIDANLELEDMAPNYQLCEEKMFKSPSTLVLKQVKQK